MWSRAALYNLALRGLENHGIYWLLQCELSHLGNSDYNSGRV